MKCLYTSDVHGNRWIYDRLFRLAKEEDAEAILLGGDLTPLTPPLDTMIENQRRFWTEDLAPRSRDFVAGGGRVLLIPGNDDLRVNDPLVEAADADGAWELVDGRSRDLDGFRVVGCSLISASPFVLKDRERYDVEIGVCPEPDAIDPAAEATIRSTEREPGDLERTLEEELVGLLEEHDGARTILMAHCPPRGTAIDVLFDGRRVGAAATRRAIERFEPVLGLHGHIHESPRMEGGSWRDAIGRTIVVNGGSNHHKAKDAHLRVISFDTRDVEGSIAWRSLETS